MTRKPTAYILLLVTACALLAGCSPDGSYMRQRLQYVSASNRADTVFTERWLPTVDSLVSYFDRHGAANDRMMAHYLKGRVHHDMGEAPQALECYQKAAEQADTTRDDCDFYTLTAIYGQMADIFHEQILPSEERQALEKSEHFAVRGNDNFAALKAFELRTRPYYLQNDTDSILYIVRESRMRYLRTGDTCSASTVLPVAINIFLDRQQYAEAYQYMRLFEKESGKFDESGAYLGAGLYDYERGRYALFAGKTDSATIYFQRVLEAGYEEAGYKGLLMYYQKKHIADSIAKYATLFARANDDSYLHVNQNAVHQISAMYDYGRQQRLAEESRATAARQKNYLVYAFFAFLFAAAIAAFSYNRVRIQNLLRISQLLKAKADLQSLLEEKQAQLDIFISKNASEIERITQESNQILIEHIREKKALEQQIEDMNRKLSLFSGASREKAFFNTPIGQRFQTIRSNIPKEAPPTDLDWNQCIKTFRDHFPSYYSFITNGHTLTEYQLRICIMIRQNYRESEMAFFLDTDKQRINRIKLQVNSKLFGIQDSSSLRKNLKEHF